jgi:hypothetical protein
MVNLVPCASGPPPLYMALVTGAHQPDEVGRPRSRRMRGEWIDLLDLVLETLEIILTWTSQMSFFRSICRRMILTMSHRLLHLVAHTLDQGRASYTLHLIDPLTFFQSRSAGDGSATMEDFTAHFPVPLLPGCTRGQPQGSETLASRRTTEAPLAAAAAARCGGGPPGRRRRKGRGRARPVGPKSRGGGCHRAEHGGGDVRQCTAGGGEGHGGAPR